MLDGSYHLSHENSTAFRSFKALLGELPECLLFHLSDNNRT